MIKKIIRVGSSKAVTLNSSHLRSLGVDHGDEVEVTYNKRREIVEISRVVERSESDSAFTFLESVNSLAIKYRAELTKLDNEW